MGRGVEPLLGFLGDGGGVFCTGDVFSDLHLHKHHVPGRIFLHILMLKSSKYNIADIAV